MIYIVLGYITVIMTLFFLVVMKELKVNELKQYLFICTFLALVVAFGYWIYTIL